MDKNPHRIKNMFDEISSYYDRMNNFISFGTHYGVKVLAVKELDIFPRSMVLDLCCGTGDFSGIINKLYPRAKIIGLDFSPKMLKLAKIKNPNGVFVPGDCTQLPFADEEFEFVTMGFGLRNIENRSKALDEIHRILKPGGKFLHLDFGYHNKISKIFDIVVPLIVKIFNKDSKHYEYLISSKSDFPEPDELLKEFEAHGLKKLRIKNYLFGTISAQILVKENVVTNYRETPRPMFY